MSERLIELMMVIEALGFAALRLSCATQCIQHKENLPVYRKAFLYFSLSTCQRVNVNEPVAQDPCINFITCINFSTI
jgi:hypothetical protein